MANLDYRRYFTNYISGIGLEIGPLNRPMVRHSKMHVQYVDRLPVSTLREHYPEFNDLELVEADFLDDAETLATVEDARYEFVIASHVLEHCKNPLKSLENWIRVIKTEGILYLVLPDYRKIFDKYRKETTLEHIILDYTIPNIKRDLAHYYEYAEKVNKEFFGRDIDVEEEAKRLFDMDYSIHFNCFTPESITAVLNYVDKYIAPIYILESIEDSKLGEFHNLIKKL